MGKDISKADWQRYIRELITVGYLNLSTDEYPVLKLTEKSDAVLKGFEKVELIASQVTEERKTEAPPHEADLFSLLKNTRQSIAVGENVPPYLIVADSTLLELATYLPQTIDEVRMISGFGDIKLQRYGQSFLKEVNSYCKARNLSSRIKDKIPKRERKANTESTPRLKTNDTRGETFKLYRSGKTIAEIAAERTLATTTIESHLSYFIQTGELDVNAFVKQEKMPAIIDAVESYGAERLAPLKEVLGDNYSYGEIKAVIIWMRRDPLLSKK